MPEFNIIALIFIVGYTLTGIFALYGLVNWALLFGFGTTFILLGIGIKYERG